MSNTTDSSINTPRHSQAVQVDLLETELCRTYSDQAVEVSALRKLNAELREQISELKKRDLERASSDDDRKANELELQRLRRSESSLRAALAERDQERTKEQEKFERRLQETSNALSALQAALAEQQSTHAQSKEALNRKLAKLTDEKWAKDLEIDQLNTQIAAEKGASLRLQEECSLHQRKLDESLERQSQLETTLLERENQLRSRQEESEKILRETQESHLHEVESLQETNAALRMQVTQLSTECSDLQAALDMRIEDWGRTEAELKSRLQTLESENSAQAQKIAEADQIMRELEEALAGSTAELQRAREEAGHAFQQIHQQHAAQIEGFLGRESQLNAEIARLRVEGSKLEKRLRDSDDLVVELRTTLDTLRNQQASALRSLEVEAERRMTEMQSSLQEDFQRRFDGLLSENRQLRQMLETRETHNESERQSLKQWQEQLSYLDQHLRQFKETVKKEKTDLLRLVRQFINELQMAGTHPFDEYVKLAEIEISKLQTQINNTSNLSPLRPKLEERLTQMAKEKDALQSTLANSKKVREERIDSLVAITKNANAQL